MKSRTRWLYLVLALCICLWQLPIGTLAAENSVIIRTPEDLEEFVKRVDFGEETDLNAVLAADLDLSGRDWLPISLESHGEPYTGTFDGGGHTISNLQSDWYGFMGRLGEGGVIRDLTLADVSISKGNFGFVELCQGRISNCVISGVMTPSSGQSRIGGIAAELESGVIENCVSYLDITFDHRSSSAAFYVGGVLGDLESLPGKTMAVLDRCAFHGNLSVSGRVPGCWGFIGGVAGSLGFYGVMANCVNTGTLSVDLFAEEDTRARIGGVVGQNFHSIGVNCANSGDISVKVTSNIETACSGIGMGVVNAYSSGQISNRSAAGAQISPYANQQNYILLDSGDLGQGVSFSQAELTDGTLQNKLNAFLRENPADKYLKPLPDVDVYLPELQFLAWRQGSDGPELSDFANLPEPGPFTFSDVRPNNYFAQPVQWALERGITSGTSPGTFSPERTCSVAEILTFLYRAEGSPTVTRQNPFSDVRPDDYYDLPARWAYANGLISGATLGGGAPCTRAMAVTWLWQLAGSPAADSAPFSDVPPSAPYAQAVAWAVSRNVTSGTGNAQFSPDLTCTRGQIVTFLYRAMGG